MYEYGLDCCPTYPNVNVVAPPNLSPYSILYPNKPTNLFFTNPSASDNPKSLLPLTDYADCQDPLAIEPALI